MKAIRLALILLSLTVSFQTVCADSRSAALDQLRKIPPPTGYSPQNDNDPKIPMLVLTAHGAIINRAPAIPFDQVLNALAALPKTAWTHGRMILYYESPPGLSSPDDHPSASEVKKVEDDLKAAGIKLIYGSSA